MDTAAQKLERRNWAAVVQIAAVLFTIEGALWTHGRTQSYWFAIAFATLIICVVSSRPRISELGIGLKGMGRACWAILFALLASGGILFAAWQFGTLRGLHGTDPISWHASFYTIWAFEQQFILNSFFYKRFEALLGDTTSAMLVTAGLFAAVHVPNPVLMPATFLGGLFFVYIFRRFRNIYPLGLAHALLGISIAMAFPDFLIRHMRVGIGYFRFYA
jgi:hypothetical protein